MPFVTTVPEELAAAAGNLQGLGSVMAAQNAAAAAATTSVVPAAADEVSALQAMQFSAYGTLYQQVGAQATAIHQALVNTLHTSADSYSATEAANAAANGASDSGLSGLVNLFNGSASGPYGLVPSVLNNAGSMGLSQVSNFGSALSDLIQLGSAGFLAPGSLAGAEASTVSTVAPAVAATGAVGAEGISVVSTVSQAPSVSGVSAAPGWAGASAAESGAASTLSTTASTAAAHGTPTAAVPAGLPAAPAERSGSGFGRPRYGVKPTVMPRPATV